MSSKNWLITLIFLLVLAFQVKAQIPKIGNDTLVDIGTWNIEWFGDTQNGPTNESLQYTNVKNVLDKTDIDVWSLCEVSDNTTFQNLLTDLGKYSSSLATYSQTQKTALIWKTSMFNMLSTQMVLTESQYNYDFAGRPPLEVVLQRKDSIYTDTLYFYIVHLKAYSDSTSYKRRKNAAGFLKTFLDANRFGKKVFVMGDWNDFILGSTNTSTTISPFLNFVNDSAKYFFTTKQLVDEGKKSYYTSGSGMIDHVMFTHQLDSFYQKGKARVLDMLPTYVSGYVSNTSDHYPVMGYYNFKRYIPKPIDHTGLNELAELGTVNVYPNPTTSLVNIESAMKLNSWKLFNLLGNEILSGTANQIDLTNVPEGTFISELNMENGTILHVQLVHQN